MAIPKKNGIYLFKNIGSSKFLNIYGLDQVGNSRNVCQWDKSAELSQMWWVYSASNGKDKLASIIKDNTGKFYALNVYRSIHKNTDLYEVTPDNDPDSALCFEAAPGENCCYIRLQNPEKDSSYLYLTAVGDANGSNSTTSTASGNVIWKALTTGNQYQIWNATFLADYTAGSFDIRKFGVQVFLKEFYGSAIELDAKASTFLCRELIRALQSELNITIAPDDPGVGVFGTKTLEACPTLTYGWAGNPNIVKILCHGLFCKGYSTTTIYDTYTNNVINGVKALQSDAGIAQDGIVTPLLFRAVLNTDSLTLAPVKGNAQIRIAQQGLNRLLFPREDMIPTNGIFDRGTSRALVCALQHYEGIEVLTGSVYENTKKYCPTLPYDNIATSVTGNQYTVSEIGNFICLLQYALCCYGYDTGAFGNAWTQVIAQQLKILQAFVKLPVTGIADRATWCALLTSRGDDTRKATACDTRFELTDQRIDILLEAGYEIVGRYINGTDFKILRQGELDRILGAGLGFFAIYQDSARVITDFTLEKAQNDAETAIQNAKGFKIPANTIIYFAVDFDATDAQVTSHILPYFGRIRQIVSQDGTYRIGIYGARNICSRISAAGWAESSFVSDMSYGYSGNLGYPLPENWNYDQIQEIQMAAGTPHAFDLDRNVFGEKQNPVWHPCKSRLAESKARAQVLYDYIRGVNDQQWNLATVRVGSTLLQCNIPPFRQTFSIELASESIEGAVYSLNVVDGEFSGAEFDFPLNDILNVSTGFNLGDEVVANIPKVFKEFSVAVQNGQLCVKLFAKEPNTFGISIIGTEEAVVIPGVGKQATLSYIYTVETSSDDGANSQLETGEIFNLNPLKDILDALAAPLPLTPEQKAFVIMYITLIIFFMLPKLLLLLA